MTDEKLNEPEFPPSYCTAWEDCNHDGLCHDPASCGAKGPNTHFLECEEDDQ